MKSDQIGLLTETDKIKAVGEHKVYDISIWDNAVKDWQDKGWIVKSMESEDCPLQITRKDGNLGMIDMGFYDNHYYIQARYEGDWNFSKCLKWDNGGKDNVKCGGSTQLCQWMYQKVALLISSSLLLNSSNKSLSE